MSRKLYHPTPFDIQLMPAFDLPDLDELAVRLVQLRHREQEVARRLERVEERHGAFPSDHTKRTLDDLRAEAASLRAEIAGLEEQLRPLRRLTGDEDG